MASIKLDQLKTIDASALQPGQFFIVASRRAAVPHAIGVRCANYENPPFGTVLLATPEGLDLTTFRLGQNSGTVVIPIEVSDVRIEVSGASRAIDGNPGALIANAESAFLSVRHKDPRFETSWDTVYLDLTEWKKDPIHAAEWKCLRRLEDCWKTGR